MSPDLLGADPKSWFHEPSVPEDAGTRLNAITRCYLIRASDTPNREPAPQTRVSGEDDV